MDYREIRWGMKVDYKVDRMDRELKDCTVTMEPWFMDLNWVCMIDKCDRCVKCADLTSAKRF